MRYITLTLLQNAGYTKCLAIYNLGGTGRHMAICSPDIRNISALEVLRNRALQIDIYLLTY